MIPFIQRVTSRSRPFRRGSAAPQLGREQRAHDLDGQRGDVVVGGRSSAPRPCGRAILPSRSTSPRRPPPAARSTPGAQVREPGRDPRLAGRRVEHAVRALARAREVEQQLHEDQPAGARAHLLGPRGDQRPRQPVREVLAERLRALVGLHVLPPALPVPLRDPPLVAAGQQREQPLEQPRDVGGGDAELASRRRTRTARAPQVGERLGRVRGRDQLVGARRPGRAGSARRRPAGRARWPEPDGIRAIVSGRCR